MKIPGFIRRALGLAGKDQAPIANAGDSILNKPGVVRGGGDSAKASDRYRRRRFAFLPRTIQGARFDAAGNQKPPRSVPPRYWQDEGDGFSSDMSEKARRRLTAKLAAVQA